MRSPRYSVSNVPIKYRLPLLMGTLLFGIITVSIWASYRGVKESGLEVGRERLSNLTQQLANQSHQATVTLLNVTFTAGNDPAVRAFLQTPSSATRPGAVFVLQQFAATQDPNFLSVELWKARHSLALTIPDGSSPEPSDLEAEFRKSATDPFKVVGAIRVVKGIVAYPAVAAVKNDAGKPLGYLVKWLKVAATPEALNLIADLLGSQASLYFGNSEGDVWTDLVKVVPKPSAALGLTLDVTYYTQDGNPVMALGRPINGTPWFVVVAFPEGAFVAQATRFLRRMLLIGLALFVTGVGCAVVLSRSITRPLDTLTQTASRIRSGDYSQGVNIHQRDELGGLAAAFNAMVARVRDSQRELERRALLFDDSPLPMWVFDRESMRFLAVNDAAIYHYGFSREEFLSMTIKDIRPPEEVPRLLEALSHAPASGLGISGHWKHRTKNGTIIDVEITSHVIEFNGIDAQVVLANDVTDRLRAEEALRVKNMELAATTQQLWQASKLATMGELAASVAHELNNPLATISLRLESLAAQLAGERDKAATVEIVAHEVERMGRLVGGLLEFSRRGHQQISTINICEELRRSVDLIEYYLRARKIDVICDFEDDLPTVQADRQQLRQVFLNLLTNASDAMPGSGRLLLRARAHQLKDDVNGVLVEFIDSGSGILKEDLERIWEPFFTTKPEGKGTGLGLAICRRVVEEHYGAISISSRPGQGTTVSIELPATNGRRHSDELRLEKLAAAMN